MQVISAETRTHFPSVASYRHLAGRVYDETLSLIYTIDNLLPRHCEDAQRTRRARYLADLLDYYEANQHIWGQQEYNSDLAQATVREEFSVFLPDAKVPDSYAYQTLVRPYVGLAGSTYQYLGSCIRDRKRMLLEAEAGRQPNRRGWEFTIEEITMILNVPESAPRGVLDRTTQISSNLVKVSEYEVKITRLENPGADFV